ncbi:hypothetical protein G7Y89_g11024 [Cudoniella acicularis]|uniref:Uncharacterized protein n=1 Tax=Cudoniella acicularis TaxID=354080 RepID=A0A8H4RDY7_9HELO|nr:hypothetical protein G7Y89_g11024 [Cudoniella acicularis]
MTQDRDKPPSNIWSTELRKARDILCNNGLRSSPQLASPSMKYTTSSDNGRSKNAKASNHKDYGSDSSSTIQADDSSTIEADDFLIIKGDDFSTLKGSSTIKADDLLIIKMEDPVANILWPNTNALKEDLRSSNNDMLDCDSDIEVFPTGFTKSEDEELEQPALTKESNHETINTNLFPCGETDSSDDDSTITPGRRSVSTESELGPQSLWNGLSLPALTDLNNSKQSRDSTANSDNLSCKFRCNELPWANIMRDALNHAREARNTIFEFDHAFASALCREVREQILPEPVAIVISSAHSLLDIMLNMDVETLRALPVYNYVRIAYSMVVLTKLYISSKTPASHIGLALDSKTIKLGFYLEAFVEKLSLAVGPMECRAPFTFLGLIMRLQIWYKSQEKDEVFRKPTELYGVLDQCWLPPPPNLKHVQNPITAFSGFPGPLREEDAWNSPLPELDANQIADIESMGIGNLATMQPLPMFDIDFGNQDGNNPMFNWESIDFSTNFQWATDTAMQGVIDGIPKTAVPGTKDWDTEYLNTSFM